MQIQTASISNRLAAKPKVKVPKEHPKYPWSDVDDEEAPRQYGDRGEHSSEEVMAFLDNL
ncbi:hypothetical protein [Gordonia alkanivorans]|nr:hypothetical protein [Gordonia alkanivorans]MDJ0006518.1 hypothetical protein [Gordonia alkanivorans]MDJ0492146.1 hypothetical protein [Gordonia alkanivorans]